MKCTLVSDLHLEHGDLTLAGGDVLIIAGDACEAGRLDRHKYDVNHLMNAPGDIMRSDRYARFFHEECSKYRQVVYVMGNHEHWRSSVDKTAQLLRDNLPANVQLLEKQTLEIDGVIFMGATMWTDMNREDALTLFHMRSVMKDYEFIDMHAASGTQRLTPEWTVSEHHATLQYFKLMLEENRATGQNKKFVVITHHTPSHLSQDMKYSDDIIMNGAYHSDLSEFILDNPEIQVWCHGHVHDDFDYTLGDTRVLCSPRGYLKYEARANNYQPITFEVNA
jgi:Icc-related predicted phosphoesterase